MPIVRNTLLFIALAFPYAFHVAAKSPDVPSIKALHAHAVKKGLEPKEYSIPVTVPAAFKSEEDIKQLIKAASGQQD